MTSLLRSRARSSLATIAAAILVTACASGGGTTTTSTSAPAEPAGPAYPQLAGDWTGSITFDGQAIPGTLQVTQTGPDLDGTFRAPELDLVTSGSGAVLPDGSLSMTLTYNLQCPGSATMTGSLSTDGMQMSGTLLASDCTGEISGSFRFRR